MSVALVPNQEEDFLFSKISNVFPSVVGKKIGVWGSTLKPVDNQAPAGQVELRRADQLDELAAVRAWEVARDVLSGDVRVARAQRGPVLQRSCLGGLCPLFLRPKPSGAYRVVPASSAGPEGVMDEAKAGMLAL